MTTKEKQPNAQKWTKKIVEAHLDEIEKEARTGVRPFLGHALGKLGLSKHVWSYWKRTFVDDEELLERMMEIDSLFELRVFEMGLYRQLDPKITLRTLKFVYKWGKKRREF